MNDIIFYTTPLGKVKVEVLFEEETFWLSQKKMAELFGVEVATINYHIKGVFKRGELQEDSVIRKIRITALDGKSYLANHYNLNIPRYVDTFEEEEEVDIKATQKEIVRLEKELADVRKEMDGHLKELGLI